ncbi:MAG: sulfite exporter TauE/SafE family protein [Erysipelotrichaceae bacterium]|nr:sulfite exporter TauE/SafE family protein [Erysipelotrichaceae bacterium]
MKILMLLVVLFATTVGALCGIGGGVIIKPVFDLVSSYDAASINFLSSSTVLAMALYSVINSFLNKKLDMGNNLFLAIFAAVGGVLGGKSFRLLKSSVSSANSIVAIQSFVLMVLIIAVYIYTLNKKKIRPLNISSQLSKSLLGFALGFISSFLGIGGGPINVAAFSYFLGLDSKKAADCSLFTIVFGQSANILTTVMTGSVPALDWGMLGIMVVLGILGGILGRKLNKKFDNETIDRLFNYCNILIILICFYNFIRNL